MESIWTRELVDNLVRLWNEGHPTAEIGRRLGLRKNQVIGKAHRIGLTPRPSPLKPGRRAAPARRPQLSAGATTGTCSWPTGHPGDIDFGFCGKKTIAGKPYCAEHAKKAYVKPAPVQARL
jgi:GcrA cell cycle regulator